MIKNLVFTCLLLTVSVLVPATKCELNKQSESLELLNEYKSKSKATDAASCQSECQNTQNCEAFSFDPTSQECLLFVKNQVNAQRNQSQQATIETPLPTISTVQVLNGIRFNGHYEKLKSGVFERQTCWNRCQDMSECVAISFKATTFECLFFNNKSTENYFDDADSVSVVYENQGVQIKSNETISEYLWRNSIDLAYKALDSTFINGVRTKSLNPQLFAKFMNQDAVYLMETVDMHESVLEDYQTQFGEDIQSYLNKSVESNKRHALAFNDTYALVNSSGIHLTEPFVNCINQKRSLTKNPQDVLYFAISNLPCYKLWKWLALQITNAQECNVYAFWIRDNAGSSGSSAKRTDELLTAHEGELDRAKALKIFRDFMSHEVAMFNL